ncbi:hypothetical protein [Aliidiomarina soli]|nr:hypothetical protein [Aliidiomarina soli]
MSLTMPQTLANTISTTLSKSEDGRWSVEYQSAEPISQLQFKRSPDNSRAQRWQLPEQFAIAYEDGKEMIRRDDGAPFTQVEAELTATYITLDKEYAPFSPFSDGGLLVYSGRFFVCAGHCDTTQNQWPMRVEAPITNTIIVQGQIYQGEAQWTDSNSGHNIYVGPAEQRYQGEFVSIIDEGLPPSLRELMDSALPEFMRFYAEHLAAPESMPQLFASYSPTSDGRYGHQGGVLPNQVFMHWYGWVDESAVNQTLWFFAHEAAHIFQQPHTFSSDAAWLHEGSAELFAELALNDKALHKTARPSAIENAQVACVNGLTEGISFDQTLKQNSRLMYSCGLVLFNAMHNDLVAQGEDIFSLWNAYDAAVTGGEQASETTFMSVASRHLSALLSTQLNSLLQPDNLHPVDVMANITGSE